MITVDLEDLGNLQTTIPNTAVTTINNNSSAIETGFDSALNTAGDTMSGNLDMNGNYILNLPKPVGADSPLRLQDLSDFNNAGTVSNIPAGGTDGQVLTKASDADYDLEWTSSSGSGSVTSVGLSLPDDFTVTGSPVTSTGTLTATYTNTPTGTGSIVRATSPTLVTPTLGAATATSLNGNTLTTGTGTLRLDTFSLSAVNTGNIVTSASAASGDLSGTYPAPTIASNAVTNAKLASAVANSLKGNPTGGLSSPTDFTIGGLTQKTSPASTDYLLIQDQDNVGALAYATVGSIATAGSVSSVNTSTGDIVIQNSSGTVNNSSGTITLGTAGGFLNKFCNASMDLWQRLGSSASISVSTSGSYTADRWMVTPTGASVSVAKAFDLANSYYSLKITGATSVTDCSLKQRIEGLMAAPLSGQNCTVQARIFNNTGSSFTPTLTVKRPSAQDDYSTTTTDVNAVSLQACPSGTTTTVAYTFAANASAYNGLEVTFDFGNVLGSASNTVQISSLDIRATPDLTVGLQSTPPTPEMRPIGIETPLCQRYYNRFYSNVANSSYASAFVFNTTSVFGHYSFPTPMRAVPVFSSTAASTFQALIGGTATTASVVSVTDTSEYSALISVTITGGTAGQAGAIRDAGTGASWIAFNSEL